MSKVKHSYTLPLPFGSVLLFLMLGLLLPVVVSPAEKQPSGQSLQKVTVAYSSISGNMAPLWVAHERGFFRKYGLDTQVVLIEGGSRAAQTLVSGDVAFAQMAGAGVIQAALRGADAVMIAGVVNTLTFQFIVEKGITQPDQLKGKSVAVTRYGSSTDFAVRFALDKYGLKPDKEVAILQLGTMPALFAALEGGKIQGAMLSSPFTLKARKAGFHLLADLQMLGLEYQHTGIATTRALIKSQPDLVRNFMKGYVEGIHYYKNNRRDSIAILQKYLKVDDMDALTEIYEDIGLTLVPEKPYPTLKGIQTILQELASKDPVAATAKAEQFVDLRFLAELDRSGFIDRLYKPTPAVAMREKPNAPAAPEPAVVKVKKVTATGQQASGAPRPSGETVEYTIKAGDTLSKLAERFYGAPMKWQKIYEANTQSVKNPNYIYIGQVIKIPPA
jgi:NitT/TauT family transport system substrate-binding protein